MSYAASMKISLNISMNSRRANKWTIFVSAGGLPPPVFFHLKILLWAPIGMQKSHHIQFYNMVSTRIYAYSIQHYYKLQYYPSNHQMLFKITCRLIDSYEHRARRGEHRHPHGDGRRHGALVSDLGGEGQRIFDWQETKRGDADQIEWRYWQQSHGYCGHWRAHSPSACNKCNIVNPAKSLAICASPCTCTFYVRFQSAAILLGWRIEYKIVNDYLAAH